MKHNHVASANVLRSDVLHAQSVTREERGRHASTECRQGDVATMFEPFSQQLEASRQIRSGCCTVHAAMVALLVAAECCIPAVSGLVLFFRGAVWAVLVGLCGTVVLAVRIGLQQAATRSARVRFAGQVAHAYASRSALVGVDKSADGIQSTLFLAIGAVARLQADLVPSMVGNVVALAVLAPLFLVYESAPLVALCAAGIALAGLVALIVRRAAGQAAARSWERSRELVDVMSVLIRGHSELAAAGRARRHARRVAETCSRWGDALLRAERVGALGGRLPAALVLAATVAVAWLWLRDRPAVFAAGVSHGLVVGSAIAIAAGLGRAVVEMARAKGDIAALSSLLDAPIDPATVSGAVPLPTDGPIELAGVTFSYDPSVTQSRPALREFSLAWNPGQCLALTGPNGSGKSTVLRLLLRFADPHEGSVRVAGRDLRDGDLERWREAIAYLPQRPYVPEMGTVREAMKMVHADLTDDAMMGALDDVGLGAVLERRSPGEPLSIRVEALSAGEKQKLALARVFAVDAHMWLLDEPDAHLDEAGMDRLAAIVRRKAREHRVLFVAHAPRLLACADRVVDFGHAGLEVARGACA